jgi:uncharacterized protein (UPF0305 family)
MSILGGNKAIQTNNVYKCPVCNKESSKNSFFLKRLFSNCKNDKCPNK